MHPKTFALLLMLVTVGCVRPGNGTADTLSSPATTFTDTVKVDSTENLGLARSSNVEWHVLASDHSSLVFNTGDTLPMHAKDLRLVTRLTSPLDRPWFIFSGIGSGGSDELRSLYVISPGDQGSRGIQQSWHMPGRLTDSTSLGMYYEASVFAGEVLRDTIGVIWYDRSLMPDGQWRLNTTLLQLDRPEPDTLVFFGQGRKSATIDLAVKGKCQVLKPIDQRTVSH